MEMYAQQRDERNGCFLCNYTGTHDPFLSCLLTGVGLKYEDDNSVCKILVLLNLFFIRFLCFFVGNHVNYAKNKQCLLKIAEKFLI